MAGWYVLWFGIFALFRNSVAQNVRSFSNIIMLVSLFCLLHLSRALIVNSPSDLAGNHSSPIANAMIGNQNVDTRITGQAIFVDWRNCLETGFDGSALQNRIVIIDKSGDPVRITDIERGMLCLERAGAIAVVGLLSDEFVG